MTHFQVNDITFCPGTMLDLFLEVSMGQCSFDNDDYFQEDQSDQM